MTKLTRDDVLKLARLARISLDDGEVARYADEFSAILEYAQQLETVDTAGLAPTSQVTGLVNQQRPDVVKPYSYAPAELLKNVPQAHAGQIKVKRMIG